MIWYQKGIGTGDEAVEIRDGKLTRRGIVTAIRLLRIKQRKPALTYNAATQLQELLADGRREQIETPKHATG
jgi:hypothetical protein